MKIVLKKYFFVILVIVFSFSGCKTVNHKKDVFRKESNNVQKVKRKNKGKNYPVITPDGVIFRLKAKNATYVTIAGQFNGWDERTIPLEKNKDGIWEVKLQIAKGVRHRYKYIVDGYWLEDPDNPDVEIDGYGGYNSIIYVPKNK